MTRMLASVTDAAEAAEAVRLGADTVDLEPVGGAVDPAVARAVVAAVGGRALTCMSLGDPPFEAEALAARAAALGAAGVDLLRLAVDAESLARLSTPLARLSADNRLVGVLFAEDGPPLGVLPMLRGLGFKGALVDTRRKGAGRLLERLDIARLADFCGRCRAEGLESWLAGSLKAPDAPRLLLARPDVIGFGAALRRDHDRAGRLDPQRFALVRDLIPRETPGGRAVQAVALAEGGGEAEVDRVFIRDFVVPASIGAYDHEREAPQRVVFDVDAAVVRAPVHADDMRAIFSYDVILDSIRLAVGRGHVQFVETLAEEVAEAVLRHARVRRVRVSVRKIDVIDGAVGIEIVRAPPPGHGSV